MGNAGGIGAFAGGFAKSFAEGRRNRRLRDEMEIETQLKAQREKRLADQFAETQAFRKQQAEELRAYRDHSLQLQEQNMEGTAAYRDKSLEGQAAAAQALEKYRQGQTDLQKKQLELNQKAHDVKLWERMDKAFDPKTPKRARTAIFKQVARAMNIDPKSEQYKEFEALINDDELAATFKQGLEAMVPNAKPGEVSATVKLLMTGNLEYDKALTAMQESIKQKAIGDALKGKPAEGGEGEQASGVPTRKVQTSRITNPTPMSQQDPTAEQSGGTLAVPGMEDTTGTGGEPQEVPMTAEEARLKASRLALVPDEDARAQAGVLLQYARDVEAGKKKTLKAVVDPEDPDKNVYMSEDDAEGMEAPSSRDVLSPEENANSKMLEGLAGIDVKRVEKMAADADNAREMAAPLSAFKAANDSGQFETGTAGSFRARMSRMARFLGLPKETTDALDAAGLGDAKTADLMESTSAQMGLIFADRLGRVTNMSLELILQAVPNALRTPEGNALVVNLFEKANQRAIKIDEKLQEYRDRGGGLRPKGRESFFDWANKERAKPLVDDEFLKQLTGAAAAGKRMGTLKDMFNRAVTEETVKAGNDTYEIVGHTDWTNEDDKPIKAFPIIKTGTQELPFIENKADGKKVPYDTPFLVRITNEKGEEELAITVRRKKAKENAK